MGEERFEALGVLAPRRATGAELGPHGQRHLCRPAGHEGHLRGLVEQLIEADAHEVQVHELHHRPHARHRRADAEAHDRRLRDRRVAHAVPEPVTEASREPEDVAAGTDVDPRQEHTVVRGELGFERVVDRVHRAEHRRIDVGARRLGKRRSRPEHEVEQRRPGPGRPGLGPRRRPRPARRPPSTPARRWRRRRRLRRGAQRRGRRAGRVPPSPPSPRASGTAPGRPRSGRATGRWPPRRSWGRRHHAGPRPRPASPTRWPRRRCRRRRRSPTPYPAARRSSGAAVLVDRRRELGVAVVLAEEDDRQPPHGGEVHRLVERALGHRTVPEEGHGDAAVGPQLRRRRRPDGDGQAGRHDAVRPEDPERSGRRCASSRPRPRLVPWSRAISSANIPRGSRPLARQWPWPRWVEVMTSAGPSGQQAPTADASCPIDRWTKPGTSPARYSVATRCSNPRITSIRRCISSRSSAEAIDHVLYWSVQDQGKGA